jgi:hypothetical protein
MTSTEVKVSNLDHLGIVAGISLYFTNNQLAIAVQPQVVKPKPQSFLPEPQML